MNKLIIELGLYCFNMKYTLYLTNKRKTNFYILRYSKYWTTKQRRENK